MFIITPLLAKMIKLKTIIISNLVFLTYLFSTNNNVLSTEQYNNFDELPDKIIIGVRTSSFPIGHVIKPEKTNEDTGEVEYAMHGGFCGRLEQQLKDEIKRLDELGELNKKIEVYSITIANEYRGKKFIRYKGLRDDNRNNIECGSNSISSRHLTDENGDNFDKNIEFVHYFDSENSRKTYKVFYETGIKLLLKKEKARELSNLSQEQLAKELTKIRIGVVTNTTTSKQLLGEKSKKHYQHVIPEGNQNDESYAREEVLDSLELPDENSIEAYASDAIVLMSLLKEGLEEKRNNNSEVYQKARTAYEKSGYVLYPDEPGKYLPYLEAEKYGIAIQKNPKQYSADVLNNLIYLALENDILNIDERNSIKEYEDQTINGWFEQPQQFVLGLFIFIIFGFGFIKVFISKNNVRGRIKMSESKEKNSTSINVQGDGHIQFVQDRSIGDQYNIKLETIKDEKALDDLKLIVSDLKQQHPSASVGTATEIINEKLEIIKDKEPQRWKDLLELKRLWNGLKQSGLNVGEHFAEETAWGQAAIGFLEGFTDNLD